MLLTYLTYCRRRYASMGNSVEENKGTVFKKLSFHYLGRIWISRETLLQCPKVS